MYVYVCVTNNNIRKHKLTLEQLAALLHARTKRIMYAFKAPSRDLFSLIFI